MITIYNKVLPFRNYKAMCLWPFLLIRKEYYFTAVDCRHEEIHGKQQREMLIVLFYLWYVLEYLFRLAVYRKHRLAYRHISFEQEAYEHQGDWDYLETRKWYSWVKYLGRW